MNGIILLPTLNRTHLVERFLKSYKAQDSSLPGLLLVDSEDFRDHQEAYQALELPLNWTIKITKGRSMGAKCQEAWDEYIDKDFVILLNDDHILETKHWDKMIATQINGVNIIGTNDGWQAPRRLCGATAWSTKVLKATGWMFPEGVNHLFIDTVWEMIGSRAQNVQIMMEVMVRHDHVFVHGKKDETHDQVYPKDWENGPDAQAFNLWKEKHYINDSQKVLDLQQKTGIMIATPCHDGNVFIDFAKGLAHISALFTQHGVYNEFAEVVGSSLIPHSRNNLVDMFLKSKCEKLLFIDADQGFTADAVLALFQSNRRIIGGITPHKRFPINLNFDPLEEDYGYFKDRSNKSQDEFIKFINERADKTTGELKVDKTGTGFLCIHRSVFELMKPYVEHYSPFDSSEAEPHAEYFKMGAEGGKYHGEDWSFMNLAKELKIPVYVSARALVSHRGHHTWRV